HNHEQVVEFRNRGLGGASLHSRMTLFMCGASRWGAPGSGAESYPLNLNQVMLAEEVRDGKGLRPQPFTRSPRSPWPQPKGTTVSNTVRLAFAVFLGIAALPAAAQDQQTLRVYTYDSFAAEWGPGPAIKAGFEKQCGCVVEFITADDAISALRRVQLEGAT